MLHKVADFFFSYGIYGYVGYYVLIGVTLLRKPSGPLLARGKWMLFSVITLAFLNILLRFVFSQAAAFPLLLKQTLWIASTAAELAGMLLFWIYCLRMRGGK